MPDTGRVALECRTSVLEILQPGHPQVSEQGQFLTPRSSYLSLPVQRLSGVF